MANKACSLVGMQQFLANISSPFLIVKAIVISANPNLETVVSVTKLRFVKGWNFRVVIGLYWQ